MQRLMSDKRFRLIRNGVVTLLFILLFSFFYVPRINAYYGLSGLGLYGGMYGGGLYGLGGLYGQGFYGKSGLYGGIGSLYGLGGLYGLNGLYGLGRCYGLGGLYGLGGYGGLFGMGLYGGLHGIGGLGGLPGGLYGLGGMGTPFSNVFASPMTTLAPLFIAEQTGTWMGTWTNGLLAGQMTLNLIDALGLITGTAQLLGNPSLGSLVDVSGTVLNAQITVSGTGLGLGGMTFELALVGILLTAEQMTGTYSIINTSGGSLVDQGKFNLALIAPVI